MKKKIRAVQIGCGPIGCSIASLALQRKNIMVLGVVDTDPKKISKDLGKVSNFNINTGLIVTDKLDSLLADTKPDIAFHSTGSSFEGVFSQIADIVSAGINVVSTCEELSYPYRSQPALAAKLDSLAKSHGVSVLSTGINPGFLMDTWPLVMTGVCQHIDSIKVVRIQDAANRRLPFQVKIGAGLTPDEFQERISIGTIRHVGLPESAAMIAAGLGLMIDKIEEQIEPVLAVHTVSSPFITVEPGIVVGVKQTLSAYQDKTCRINLEFQAYIGARDSYDSVSITGKPNLEVVIKGGVHGDTGTAAMAVNAAHRVVESPAGLLTMKDIPPVICS